MVPVGSTEEAALLSDAEFDGGVRRLPRLTAAEPVWWMCESGGYLCAVANCKLLGGGSSKLGRFEAACLRAVRLDGALRASIDVPIGARIAVARVSVLWRKA